VVEVVRRRLEEAERDRDCSGKLAQAFQTQAQALEAEVKRLTSRDEVRGGGGGAPRSGFESYKNHLCEIIAKPVGAAQQVPWMIMHHPMGSGRSAVVSQGVKSLPAGGNGHDDVACRWRAFASGVGTWPRRGTGPIRSSGGSPPLRTRRCALGGRGGEGVDARSMLRWVCPWGSDQGAVGGGGEAPCGE
jgi:hypothetical protein